MRPGSIQLVRIPHLSSERCLSVLTEFKAGSACFRVALVAKQF